MVLGVREIVIGVVALLLAYVAYLALRFVRLPRRGPKPEPEIHPEYQTVLDLDPEPPRSATPSARAPETVTAALTTGAPEREAREPFDAMVELARLRFQIEALQAGQLTLRADLDSLRGELEALRNARNVARRIRHRCLERAIPIAKKH